MGTLQTYSMLVLGGRLSSPRSNFRSATSVGGSPIAIAKKAHIMPRMAGTLHGDGSALDEEGYGSGVEFAELVRRNIVPSIVLCRAQAYFAKK